MLVTSGSQRLKVLSTTIKLLIFIFLHFRVQYDFLAYLAKFQSITNIRGHSFFTFN